MPPMTPPAQATPPARLQGEGATAQSRVAVNNAARLLKQALGTVELNSDIGKAILTALKALAPVTPEVDDGVSQSEIRSLLASADTAKGPGGAPPAPSGGGGLGPMPPRPMAMAGMPFGLNQAVGAPSYGG